MGYASTTVAIVKAKIIRRFANANAFNEDTAKTLKELDLENKHRLMINSLLRRNILIETHNEKFYLSYDYYQRRQSRKKILIPILCIFIILFLIIAILGNFNII